MTHARGIGLFYGGVQTVLGLLGVVLFIVGVISLAAGVTYLVVRLTPAAKDKKKSADAAAT